MTKRATNPKKKARTTRAALSREYRRAFAGTDPDVTELRIPVAGGEPSSVAEIEARLRAAGIVLRSGHVPAEDEREVLGAAVEVVVALDDESRDGLAVRLAARPASGEVPETELDWSRLTKPEVDAARASEWTVVVRGVLRPGTVLADYHRLLRAAAAVAPDACAVMDVNAFRTHPARWLADAASTRVPPSPQALYTIHSVYDDKGKNPGVWLHTHGLLRCGTLELEMADIPMDGVSAMGTLLNAVAPMFIDHRAPGPREAFAAGREIELVWLPWEEVVGILEEGTLGGPGDRDEHHSRPSAVLFAPGRKEASVRSPAVHVATLEDNPVLYVSDMETERMSLLSRERLPTFLELFRRPHEGWMFLVKLGYEIDGAEDETDREHLWFEVHGVRGVREVDATLLNQPYHIARMKEGQRGWHPLSKLSGWSILTPDGRYGPESAKDLERSFRRPDEGELQ